MIYVNLAVRMADLQRCDVSLGNRIDVYVSALIQGRIYTK